MVTHGSRLIRRRYLHLARHGSITIANFFGNRWPCPQLRCLNFLDEPDSGTITIGDLSVDAARASKDDILGLRRRTGFVFQNYALFANKTARQNITEALVTVKGMNRADADARASSILPVS